MPDKLKLLYVALLLGISSFFACFGDITSSGDQLPSGQSPPPDYSQLAAQLENAYQKQSQDSLDIFFESWMEKLPAYTAAETAALSDTIRQVYDIFREFYSPTDLSRVTGGRHENFETEFRYIVIQNDLQYAITDTIILQDYYFEVETSYEKMIPDFRPPQGALPFPVVYLSAQADTMIYNFLYQPVGERKEDHASRVAFLREAMQLTHHHWISDYHKATMPVVTRIYIHDSLTQAIVTFRVFYQFGHAYLERSESGWTLISSRLTAIE